MFRNPRVIVLATRGPICVVIRPLNVQKIENWRMQQVKVPAIKDLSVTAYKTIRERYDRLTGMPEIISAQKTVSEIQQQMIELQNQKGPVKLEIHKLREELQNLNHSLQMCKRQDSNYLSIISRIVELNQREEVEQEKYDLIEEQSRATFTNLMMAVQNSQELDRNQTAHFKYFSWIFSIVWGGLTSLIFLLKYLTQTTGFNELQESFRHNAQTSDKHFSTISFSLNDITQKIMNLDRKTELIKVEQQKPKTTSSSLYDWAAWACSPLNRLKFW